MVLLEDIKQPLIIRMVGYQCEKKTKFLIVYCLTKVTG